MIGLSPEEAVKRLNEQGAAFEIIQASPRKRVFGKTEPRVMRVREKSSGLEEGRVLELLVGEFRVFDGDGEVKKKRYIFE